MTTTLRAALVLAVLATGPAHARDDESNIVDDTPHITLIGTARAEVVPDIAEISLGVSIEKPVAAEAMAETSRMTTAIIGAAKAQGVAAQDIATQNITLTQTFDDVTGPNGAYMGHKPRGFEAANTIAIRARALDKAGALAQSLIEKGTTQFNGIHFYTEHPEPVLDRLLAEAVRDAKRRAMIAAEAIGAKLGHVLLIERPSQAVGGGVPVMAVSRMAAPASSVPIEAGTQTLSTQMEVTWALE